MKQPLDSDGVWIICMTILIILCVGDPDILDGLIKMVNKP